MRSARPDHHGDKLLGRDHRLQVINASPDTPASYPVDTFNAMFGRPEASPTWNKVLHDLDVNSST